MIVISWLLTHYPMTTAAFIIVVIGVGAGLISEKRDRDG
jgi:hypothetical protein